MKIRRLLAVLAVATAVLSTRAAMLDLPLQVCLFKPLATLALVAIVLHTAGASRYRRWIAACLVASLAGDILLMLPQGLFVPGLAAFLIAHLCYIRAFSVDGAGARAPVITDIPVFVAALAAAGSLFFLASDSALAINRFVAPFAGAAWVILGTCYTAQWGLTLSASGARAERTPD